MYDLDKTYGVPREEISCLVAESDTKVRFAKNVKSVQNAVVS